MRKLMILFTILICTSFFEYVQAKNIDLDSLKKSIEEKPTKKKFDELHDLIFYMNKTNADSSLLLAKIYLDAATKFKNKQVLSNANYSIATVYYVKGEFDLSIKHFKLNLKFIETDKDIKKQIETYNSLGLVYTAQGKVKEASNYFFKALKLCKQETKDLVMLSTIYQNLGLVYNSISDFKKAIEYIKLSVEIDEKSGKNEDLAYSYMNLGSIYANLQDYENAKIYLNKSVEKAKAINDLAIVATAYSNLGLISYFENDFKSAKKYFEDAIEMKLKIGQNIGYLETLNAIGTFYLGESDYKNADLYCRRAYEVAQRINYPLFNELICNCISESAYANGNFKEALAYYKLSVASRDSLYNLDHKAELAEEENKLKYQIRTTADSVKRAEEKKVEEARLAESKAKLEQEKTQRYALIGGIILVLAFSIFIFNRLRVIRKQRDLIALKEKETQEQKRQVEIQKEIIEEKHKEITDSINYAERIQKSFLASQESFTKYFKDYFIYFLPKDVVSGDFYWSTELKNGQFCFAAADSTGHGVPGAIMSILNITSLENAVKMGLTKPNEILNQTRMTIIERLKRDGTPEGGKDGMDCSIVSFDKETNKIQFSLANNPLWLIRNNQLTEFKPNKMPVGKHDKQNESFSNNEIQLEKGDSIYILTDGYADQFGGPKGKKFKYSSLQQLLLDSEHLSKQDQLKLINQKFIEWKNELEQVDDVCIIGIRV